MQRASTVSCNEIASPHSLPEARNHARFGLQLTRSNHEIEPSEMGFNGSICTAEISRCACRRGGHKQRPRSAPNPSLCPQYPKSNCKFGLLESGVSAPSPTQPGFIRLAQYGAQVGQARLVTGEGWGGASLLLRDARAPTRPPPLTPPHKGEGNRPVVWSRPCITPLSSPRAAPHWQCAGTPNSRRQTSASVAPARGSLHFRSFATACRAISLSLPTSRFRGKRSWTPAPKSARTLRLRSRTLL